MIGNFSLLAEKSILDDMALHFIFFVHLQSNKFHKCLFADRWLFLFGGWQSSLLVDSDIKSLSAPHLFFYDQRPTNNDHLYFLN